MRGKGFEVYHVEDDGTVAMMKPRKPNSVPLNGAATVLTGGLWLITAMPIISSAKWDHIRYIKPDGQREKTPETLGEELEKLGSDLKNLAVALVVGVLLVMAIYRWYITLGLVVVVVLWWVISPTLPEGDSTPSELPPETTD